MSRPSLSMSVVASALASITGSCSCGISTVVTSCTRSVQAATAPSSVRLSGLSNAIRSPQHSDENGPLSTRCAHAFSVTASRLGSITGRVIPIRTSAILTCRANPARLPTVVGRQRAGSVAGGSFCARIGSVPGGANSPPRSPPPNVRTATRHQVANNPM